MFKNIFLTLVACTQAFAVSTKVINSDVKIKGSAASSRNLQLSGVSGAGSIIYSNPASSGEYNWRADASVGATQSYSITPSTAVDGSTFTNSLLKLHGGGVVTIGNSALSSFHVVNGALSVVGVPVSDYTMRVVRGTAGITNGAVTLQITDITTDDTEKQAVLGLDHYDNSNADIALIAGYSQASATTVYVGGGIASTLRAATALKFYTDTSNTSGGGVERGGIDTNGKWTLGTASSTQSHIVNGTQWRVNADTNGDGSLQVRNANAGASAAALLYLETSGSGDAKTQYFVAGGADWAHGIDNSDSDAWVLSNSANLGTNTGLKIDTSLNVSMPGGDLTVTGDTTSLAKFRGGASALAVADTDPSTNTLNFGTNASAMFMVVDTNTGLYAGFAINGGGTLITKLWGEVTWTIISGTPASINVTNAAGTVTFQNKTGSALSLRVTALTPN